jgi:hypothetical protein
MTHSFRRGLFASAAIAAGAVLALSAGPAASQNKSVKIGFVSTFSGPTAVIGEDMRRSFELALDHIGRKMGGLPVEVIYEDDAQKPDVGLQKTQKLIQSDRVDFCWLYLVERAARLLQAHYRLADIPDQCQRRSASDCRRIVLAVVFLDLLAERPDAASGRHLT